MMAGVAATLVGLPVAAWLPGHDVVSVGLVVGAIGTIYALVALTVMWRRDDELFPRRILRMAIRPPEGPTGV